MNISDYILKICPKKVIIMSQNWLGNCMVREV